MAKYNQTSIDKGWMKENLSAGGGGTSFVRILMPNVMNGIEKSTAEFLSDVIVISQAAKSAF